MPDDKIKELIKIVYKTFFDNYDSIMTIKDNNDDIQAAFYSLSKLRDYI